MTLTEKNLKERKKQKKKEAEKQSSFSPEKQQQIKAQQQDETQKRSPRILKKEGIKATNDDDKLNRRNLRFEKTLKKKFKEKLPPITPK